MRVSVDYDRCDSNGVCADLAPEVFELGEDDQLAVLAERPDEALWPAVEAAARGCPKLAIALRDTQ